MIGLVAGRSCGAPAASKPSSTCGCASSGKSSPMVCSRLSLPCSTSCMQAAAVTALVIEAIQNTLSGVTSAPPSMLCVPKAPS